MLFASFNPSFDGRLTIDWHADAECSEFAVAERLLQIPGALDQLQCHHDHNQQLPLHVADQVQANQLVSSHSDFRRLRRCQLELEHNAERFCRHPATRQLRHAHQRPSRVERYNIKRSSSLGSIVQTGFQCCWSSLVNNSQVTSRIKLSGNLEYGVACGDSSECDDNLECRQGVNDRMARCRCRSNFVAIYANYSGLFDCGT